MHKILVAIILYTKTVKKVDNQIINRASTKKAFYDRNVFPKVEL